MGTCSHNLNFVGTEICRYSKFEGAQNLFILKFAGLRFVGTQNFVGTQISVLVFILIYDTPILGHFHLWVLKICGYIKFVMIQNSG